MKKYLKSFLLRGLIFGGFGPIVVGIIYYIISLTTEFSLGGKEMLIAITSSYLLAFVHAGASVFNQIEEWSTLKGLGFHFLTLYLAYVSCYLVNSWIPFDWVVVLIFTLIFVVAYFIIWLIIYLIIKNTTNKMNKNI